MSSESPKKVRRTYNPTHLRAWREFRDLSLDRAIERLTEPSTGEALLTKQSLSRVERGLQPYSQPLLEALAVAYNCDPSDLLRPPPVDHDNELERYVMRLDAERRKRALIILRTALGDDEKSA